MNNNKNIKLEPEWCLWYLRPAGQRCYVAQLPGNCPSLLFGAELGGIIKIKLQCHMFFDI